MGPRRPPATGANRWHYAEALTAGWCPLVLAWVIGLACGCTPAPPVVVSGRVLYDDGNPAGGVRVCLVPATDDATDNSRTDVTDQSQGLYVLVAYNLSSKADEVFVRCCEQKHDEVPPPITVRLYVEAADGDRVVRRGKAPVLVIKRVDERGSTRPSTRLSRFGEPSPCP